jgi:hypothetical protein
MDTESLRTVIEDLEHLKEGWGPDISDPDIRRGSAVLRRLLVEDAYGQAWRAVGFAKQPKVIAVCLMSFFRGMPLHDVECALAAGANFRGIHCSAMTLVKSSSPPPSPSAPFRKDGFPGERELDLSDFVASPSGIVRGSVFSRRDVIKYIANVRGGVHLQGKGRQREKALRDRMGRIEKRMIVHTTDGLLVELVAIAQAIASSDDSERLLLRHAEMSKRR